MTGRSMILRAGEKGDLPSLVAVEQSAAQVFRHCADLAWLADGECLSLQAHEEAILQGYHWVAVKDGMPIGFTLAAEMGRNLHLREVSVRLDWQGKGVGTALIQRVLSVARERGFSGVTLTTFRDVPWNAPFYRTLGFLESAPATLSPELKAVLDAEAAHGFPPDRRCAMRYSVGAP